MKKTISMSLIVILCLAVFFSQAFASSGSPKPKHLPNLDETPEVETADEQGPDKANQHPGRKYNFKGEVTSFTGGVLVITGKHGGTTRVDDNTEIKVSGPEGGPTGIQVGQQVMAQSTKTESGFLALRVHIFPTKPAHVHRVGVVTDYQPGVSITIQGNKGSSTFKIAPDVQILPAERADQLKVGARVTIVSPEDTTDQALTATGIVVHPEKGPGKK